MKLLITPEEKNIPDCRVIKIKWHYNTLGDMVDQTWSKITSENINKKENIHLMGYSIGGFVALNLAPKLNLKKLSLYSPSPLFKETKKSLPKSFLNFLGKKRTKDIECYSVNILNNIKVPTEIYIGEKETKDMKEFSEYLNKNIKNSSLYTKEGCNHNNVL